MDTEAQNPKQQELTPEQQQDARFLKECKALAKQYHLPLWMLRGFPEIARVDDQDDEIDVQ